MANKRGEKSLQMIFGLFILLIISLVILSLFFKFTEKSSGTLTETQTDFFTKQQFQNAIGDCQSLCSGITNQDTAIEFCKAFQRADRDGDQDAASFTKSDYGQWQFCEDRIPCFVLHDCVSGQTRYDGAKCRTLLMNKRPDFYAKLRYDTTEVTGDVELATCGLSDVVDRTDPAELAKTPNWVLKYGYFEGAPDTYYYP